MSDLVHYGQIIADSKTLPLLVKAGFNTFRDYMDFEGGVRICHKRGRSVFRFEIDDRAFYLKRNRFHWVEFLKGLSKFKLPPRGALREWENILAVRSAGISTVFPVAMGERPLAGIETSSFTLTEELYNCRPLDKVFQEDFNSNGQLTAEKRERKRNLIYQVASIARKLHGNGMYHQDFYLSHFFLGKGDVLYLIDLQRVNRLEKVPYHYRIKDLGQLNYSADFIGGFSRTDRLRFFHVYLAKDKFGAEDRKLMQKVQAKTGRIARHDVKLLARRRKRGELP